MQPYLAIAGLCIYVAWKFSTIDQEIYLRN